MAASGSRAMLIINSTCACVCRHLFARNTQSLRHIKNLYVFSHVYLPERTPDGQMQRKPSEHPDFQKYVVTEDPEFKKDAPPVKVILLRDIEDLGEVYDVVEVPALMARAELIPLQKAAYASPFDLEYYARKKKEMQTQLESRVRIPKELLDVCRTIMNKPIPVHVSATDEWTLDKEIVLISLQQCRVFVDDPGLVHLSEKACTIRGPNASIEGSFFRFYITLDDKMIVPMLGRIMHVSSDKAKQNLFPKFDMQFIEDQLEQFGLRRETFYFAPKGLRNALAAEEEGGIAAFMASRAVAEKGGGEAEKKQKRAVAGKEYDDDKEEKKQSGKEEQDQE